MPPTPRWNTRTLARHHCTRPTQGAISFEDLLGITGRTMMEAQYELRSLDAITNAWAEYEGEDRDVEGRTYYPLSTYFVDLDELRTHHRRGVRFLFLMAGTPARAVAPVAVDLELTP